jgi:virulence-associated protein VagC
VKARIASLLVLLVLFVAVGFAASTNFTEDAQAAPAAQPALVNCTDLNIGQQIRIRCTAAGVVVLDTVIDLPVVTLPPVTLPPAPPVTITPPRATATVRVPQPQATVTETVRVPVEIQLPGGTTTIIRPGEGRTVTAQPRPNAPETVTASALPAPTQTVTLAPERSRQPATEGDTIDPGNDNPDLRIPEVELDAPEAAALGLGVLAIIAALIVLGMWAGYYMGYKDSDKAEAKFLKSLLGR